MEPKPRSLYLSLCINSPVTIVLNIIHFDYSPVLYFMKFWLDIQSASHSYQMVRTIFYKLSIFLLPECRTETREDTKPRGSPTAALPFSLKTERTGIATLISWEFEYQHRKIYRRLQNVVEDEPKNMFRLLHLLQLIWIVFQ